MQENRERETAIIAAHNAEMEKTVERTKDLGLFAAIRQLELFIEHDFGSVRLKNGMARLSAANALPDSDPEKVGDIQGVQEIVELANKWILNAPKILDFLKQVQTGEYPENWLETPEWSVEGYPYEGIYKNNVVRWQATMEMQLKKSGIDPAAASEEQKRKIAKEIVIEDARYHKDFQERLKGSDEK